MFPRPLRNHRGPSRRVEKPSRHGKRATPKSSFTGRPGARSTPEPSLDRAPPAESPVVTVMVGNEGRLFAAHESVLRRSPLLQQVVSRSTAANVATNSRVFARIALPEEEPEVFSAVLEFLYQGDYSPRLVRNDRSGAWELERPPTATSPMAPSGPAFTPPIPVRSSDTGGRGKTADPTVSVTVGGVRLLRDTVIYCAADRYGLEELKRVSLIKQGLQSGINVAMILRSATYAYAHTSDLDSRLRAHYLALIIRCRSTFKQSGTMQAEMEQGGSKLFFDLFVAMCNNLDDLVEAASTAPLPVTPRTV